MRFTAFFVCFEKKPYLGWDESLQHVDALHDDEGLQHVHLELQRLFAKVVEVGEGRCEKLPQHLSFLGGSFLQPTLNVVKMGFFQLH